MSYQAVFFDMDGTLIDSVGFHSQAFGKFFEFYEIYIDPDELEKLLGNSIKVVLSNVLPVELHEDAIERLATFYKSELDDIIKDIPVLPGVRETLSWIQQKTLPMFLVTNSKSELVEKIIKIHHLDFFAEAIGADKNSLDKISRCRNLINKLGLKPKDVLYVGDTAGDILMSDEVGMDSCLILNSYSWFHSEKVTLKLLSPTIIIENIVELKKFIKD